ncbi:MAG: site-specific DNA-methyltransferase [Armatimonadetes bacterium]|nr:site-specific DNA-methyltransferase [Armatimonadota bacterium]
MKRGPEKTKVEYLRHDHEGRVNIPTQELKDFVADDEVRETRTLYPRDPSLDPQLVWKGKDEQDREDLAVPTVPIYIQEKIHPSAIIEDLKSRQATSQQPLDLNLFSDFNGIEDFEKKVDFYHHEGHWTNRMILGDSLLVMNSLAEKEGLKGRVQCIYFDPPYGIKFGSNWQVSTRKRQVGDKVEDATRQPEQVRAFRDTWKLGIHSYLSYLRDRLVIARELLTESGSIFVQIGDENVHLARNVLDEVFGSENFISQITFVKTGGLVQDFLKNKADFIVWYGKNRQVTKARKLFSDKEAGGEGADKYTNVELPDGTRMTFAQALSKFGSDLPAGTRTYRLATTTSEANQDAEVELPIGRFTGKFKTNPAGIQKLWIANRIVPSTRILNYVRFIEDFPAQELSNVWDDIGGIQSRLDPKVYVVQTALEAVKRCFLMTTDPGDLILDPTCGSGTAAYVAEQWGRRWITIDTSRVALTLARTRLMGGRFPYYIPTDSPEGLAKEAEVTGKIAPSYVTENDIRKGFVYKRVPHIKLSDIANNPDIKEGMSRAEIDQAILRHAGSELLFDQPYEDPKRVRVTGPFTVESLAPHRVLETDPGSDEPSTNQKSDAERPDFSTMILDNLRKAGVQNQRKGEKLKFDALEPYSGLYLQAKGTYTDAEGKIKTVAVSIGPEYGTVGPDWVKEAAKEAVKGVGFDLLIVCAFSFDGYASEEAKQYGNLTVLPVRMNNDLSMGDDLLKKTGAGNLFMVFGEPDLTIHAQADGKVVVEVRGLDVYDPTTGQIRSGSTDDLAVWFIDTNYNGESFFVRHAYFLGADEPYAKLKRALRAEIDEGAWSALYSTTSQPFPKPETGKIAVKVINHFGDEVLKVYEVGE